ncbi:hypothetical protein [Flavobacterium sp. UBA7663]|uniref:hypothetical protein n=1 Tax=Flavobacterium sp. UBA7663 TaxID=1946557 RepID=UPI0025C3A46C|nr:hypothetical protein [Flavobacterium sp. UBA7663]
MNSSNIDNKNERIETLSKEVKLNSVIDDAEFDLFNVNGFSGDFSFLPGASSSFYQFAIKVNPVEIKKWEDDLLEIKGEIDSEKWIADLVLPRKNNWKTLSKPRFYTRKGNEQSVKIIIFEKEGLIFKRINQE